MSDDSMTNERDGADAPPARSRIPLIAAILMIVAAFGYLVYGGIAKNIVWNMTPNQLLAQGVKAYDHPVRLGGQVVPGSIEQEPGGTGLNFRMRDTTGPEIFVKTKAIPTAMFREGIGVVVEGKYQREGSASVFNATTLMVKHSNEYQPPEGMKKSGEAYKTLLKDAP